MKILAVRGENLASLAGSFDIDFCREPLLHVGLIAVTGPTGAGKSTVLDAICLSLFNASPRLARHHNKVKVADDAENETIGIGDTRGILRRGSASCFAETVFRAVDGKSYRARWEVHRAHGKKTGKLSKVSMSLWDVAADKLLEADKITAVTGRIQSLLGLTFDQFRRSVLLAQGDFAAFLNADANDRSELLEKATGSEIYSKISKSAYARAKEFKLELQSQEKILEAASVLDEEQRAVLESDLKSASETMTGLGREELRLKEIKAFYEVLHELERSFLEAERLWQEIDAEKDGIDEKQRELVDWERVRPYQNVLNTLKNSHLDLKAQTEQLLTAQSQLDNLTENLLSARERLQQRDEAYREQRTAVEALRPLLNQARKLDTQLESAEKVRDQYRDQRAEAGSRLERVSGSLVNHRNALKELQQRLKGLRDLALRFSEVESFLDQLDSFRQSAFEVLQKNQTLDNLKHELAESGRNLEKLFAETTRLTERLELEATALSEEEDRLTHRREALHALNPKAVEQRLRKLEADVEAQRERETAFRTWSNLRDQSATLEKDFTRAEKESRQQLETVSALSTPIQETTYRLKECKEMRDRMVASRKMAEARRHLKPGDPCPLCGSENHFPERVEEQGDMLDEINLRLEDLEQKLAGLQRDRDLAEHQAHASKDQASKLRKIWQEVKAKESAMELPLREWMGQGEGSSLDAEALAARLEATSIALSEEKTTFNRLRETIQNLRSAIETEEKTLNQKRSDFKALETQAQKTRMSLDTAKSRQEKLKADVEKEKALRDRDQAFLEPLCRVFPSLRKALQEDSHAELTRAFEDLDEISRKRRQRLQDEAQLSESEREVEALEKQVEERQARVTELETALANQQQQVTELLAARALLFDGKPADLIEKTEEAELQTREQSLALARENVIQLQTEETELKSTVKTLQTSISKLQDQISKGESEKATLSEKLGMSPEKILRLSELSQDIMDETRRQVQNWEKQAATISAVKQERKSALEKHKSQTKPDIEETDLETLFQSLTQRQKEAENHLFQLRKTLENDNEARTKREKLGQALKELADRAEVWSQINAVIGSESGAKFRRFAQSLTLDMLTANANHHLKELAPRYRLQRIPNYDMDLQIVDRDLGDQVRSVTGLSGGETFLVSLALALGLASLRNTGSSIESLFIDEGFGALDPESLDIALQALDNLQAGGRQVTVISHVPSLIERVATKIKVIPINGSASKIVVHGL